MHVRHSRHLQGQWWWIWVNFFTVLADLAAIRAVFEYFEWSVHNFVAAFAPIEWPILAALGFIALCNISSAGACPTIGVHVYMLS